MATITKRKQGQWQAKIRKKGYQAQSKTFQTKAKAERWARLVESEMDRGVFMSTTEAETTLLSELLNRYVKDVAPLKKSEADIKCRSRLLDKHMGHLVLAAITPGVVKEYRDFRLEKVKGETIRKEILLLSRVLKIAQKEWDIYLPRGNPVESISLPNKSKPRDRRFENGEEERLIQAAKEYGNNMAEIIILAIETGMRRGEFVKLQWNNIDFKTCTAILLDTKNTEDRKVPLSSRAIDVLMGLPRHINGRVFSRRADSITKAFDRICKRAEIDGLTFHDIRHEATSRFFELGLGIMEVSSITGHKDLGMLKRYTHLKAEDLAKKLG